MKQPTLEFDSIGDEGLMAELVRQRPEALQKLYERHRPVLHVVAMRVLNDEKDAEEVLQDVFLQLWRHAENYSAEKGKPLSWLITLARRRAIDRVRQRTAYRRATERFEKQATHQSENAAKVGLVERDACRSDLRQYLEKIVSKLPPLQQDVIERAFFGGMSQREIAATTRLPLGTVKTRIELGLRKLSSMAAASRDRID